MAASAGMRFAELCDLISRATGVDLFPYRALHYRDLAHALERGEVAVAWMPPIPTIELDDRGAATVLALPVRRGVVAYHTALFSGPRGPRLLDELKGTRAAWVDRESASGHLVARMHLSTHRYDLSTLFSRQTFLHSHEAVVRSVVSGRADVGATFCTIDPTTRAVAHGAWTSHEGHMTDQVQILATAGPIPNDAVIASTELDEEVRHKLLSWFLEPDPAALPLFGHLLRAEGFRAARAAHYAPLRRLIAEAKALGYGPPSAKTRLKA